MIKLLSSIKKIPFKKKNVLNLPQENGIYIFSNQISNPIYIGKSVNLRSRVDSYLSNNLLPKTKAMVTEAVFVSYIITNSEIEALLLEANLVKKYQTRYNSALKDGKSPIYIIITDEKYPRIITCRKTEINFEKDNYFGPFQSSTAVKEVLKYIRKIIPYSDHPLSKKACIYSQIGLCNPCPSEINALDDSKRKLELRRIYLKNIKLIKAFLSGGIKRIKNNLEKEMVEFSNANRFEEADQIKRKIDNLNYVTLRSIKVSDFLRDPNFTQEIREKETSDLTEILSKYFSINKLKRIECYDVAHLGGSNPTASMVTFINASAQKTLYRHFKIHQKKSNDDLSSLKEVAQRRKKYLESWGKPDLIIVDGGKTQVKVFNEIYENLKIKVVGLAKKEEELVIPIKNNFKYTYTVFKVPNGPALNLLMRIRDEAHRFARRYHHKLVSKNLLNNI